MTSLNPFENESQTIKIDNLQIENRTDKVTIYGDIDITKDRKGLESALKLQAVINQIVDKLLQEKTTNQNRYETDH